jgi:alpha-1,6-mannosyltransferase
MHAPTGARPASAQELIAPAHRGSAGAHAAAGARRAPWALCVGAAGLAGVVASTFLISARAATRPTSLVPARSGGWPDWLAGPLRGLDVGISRGSFQAFTLALCACYLLVLVCASRLPLRAIAATIVAAHVVLLLGPPLVSQDVFGYIGYARLGALHGLDPYTHLSAEAPGDPVFAFLGWPFKHSPYGPLFTLGSYATAPLGVAGALWAFKALALLCSLGAVAFTTLAGARLGRPARFTAAFIGLNPVLLELAVGGAHNDTMLMLAIAVALVLSGAPARGRLAGASAALVAGIGIKVTAALTLPFLLLAPGPARERARAAGGAALSLALLAVVGLVGFGSHALGFVGAVSEQQQLVAVHSVPAETARLVGLSGTPAWWRHAFLGVFVALTAFALWRTARGADWRTAAGWATLALLAATAWLLPWYVIWALPLAAVSGDWRLRAVTLLFCAYAILIHLPLAEPLLSPAG